MLGDMMGQMQEMQDKVQAELKKVQVEAEAGGGAVVVQADGTRTVTNITIKPEAVDPEDPEAIEDLVMVAVNRALALAAEKEQETTQRVMQELLPPGLGGLSGLFGQ